MSKIIIANIGNRNISWKGKSLDRDKFRELTFDLLNRFEVERENINPEILPVLFNHLSMDEISGIVLFYSDSPPDERNNQDTIYEAEILKKIFEKQYPHIQVDLKPLRCSVVDNNGLMLRYRRYLKIMKTEYPSHQFILCDAGGTAQQKASLKIMAEYLFDEDEFSTFNVKQSANHPVEKIDSIEYRKVIDGEQVAALTSKFNYAGALQILALNQHHTTNQLYRALHAVNLLFTHDLRAAFNYCKNCFGKAIKDFPVLQQATQFEWYSPSEAIAKLTLTREQINSLAVLLDIAEAYRQISHFGFYILYSHIFQEEFLSYLINNKSNFDIDDRNGWGQVKKEIIAGNLFPDFSPPGGRTVSELNSASMPVKIRLVESLHLQSIQPLIESFSYVNSWLNDDGRVTKIDILRNKFAHEGKTITQANHDDIVANTSRWRELWGLSDETIFHRINNELMQKIYS